MERRSRASGCFGSSSHVLERSRDQGGVVNSERQILLVQERKSRRERSGSFVVFNEEDHLCWAQRR